MSTSEAWVAKPALSVVICTWNRAEMLRRTLESIEERARESLQQVELIVVDNASTDRTALVAADFGRIGVRYHYEGKAGLSNARNTGVAASRAPWVLFLDDDVEIAPSLFAKYLRCLAVSPPYEFFGGPVRPVFDGPERTWTEAVMRAYPWIYSCLDLGPPSRMFAPKQFPFGANLCVKRELLLRFPFSPRFGYQHGILIPGEETALLARVVATGGAGRWLNECWVDHLLPAARNSLPYLIRRAYSQGKTEGTLLREASRSRLWAFRELVFEVVKLPLAGLKSQAHLVCASIRIATLIGIIRAGDNGED